MPNSYRSVPIHIVHFFSQLEDAKKVLVFVSFVILNFSGIRHFDPKFLPLVQIYHSLQEATVDGGFIGALNGRGLHGGVTIRQPFTLFNYVLSVLQFQCHYMFYGD